MQLVPCGKVKASIEEVEKPLLTKTQLKMNSRQLSMVYLEFFYIKHEVKFQFRPIAYKSERSLGPKLHPNWRTISHGRSTTLIR